MRTFETMIQKQRAYFLEGHTKNSRFRIQALQTLREMLQTNESVIYEALRQDLNKSEHEAFTTEYSLVYAEIKEAIKKLRRWMRHQKVSTPLTHVGSKSYIIPEPYGVVAIFSPWNYPFQLAMTPLVSAIAAGNCVTIKLSEHAPHTSEILAHLIRKTFDPAFISVVLGTAQIAQNLIKERFDYIFFTGNGTIGREVMRQASEHLTPVTLELGGKSPVIVDKEVELDLAAKRIVWGKFTNAGQTCVAPDYVYVHESLKNLFLEKLEEQIKRLYSTEPLHNQSFPKIIHAQHFKRLVDMLHTGSIYYGGECDEDTLRIAPTIMVDITPDSPLFTEEIFGPILPVLTYEKLTDVVKVLQQKDKPLALYMFSTNNNNIVYVQQHLSFGGGCINDTLYHVANTHLPFGGVGASGMGSYHGKFGFETFSHMKSIVKQTNAFDLPFRYPAGKKWLSLLKRFLS